MICHVLGTGIKVSANVHPNTSAIRVHVSSSTSAAVELTICLCASQIRTCVEAVCTSGVTGEVQGIDVHIFVACPLGVSS
jgi:hypothetical protein